MKKVILDTNAYTNFFKNYPKLEEFIEKADKIYMSPIVYGELIEGFRQGSRESINRQNLDEFLAETNVDLMEVTRETAEIYAQIRIDLRKKGLPIPVNDVWIAAQAMEMGAVLVTYDKHLEEIPGLRIWGE